MLIFISLLLKDVQRKTHTFTHQEMIGFISEGTRESTRSQHHMYSSFCEMCFENNNIIILCIMLSPVMYTRYIIIVIIIMAEMAVV